jgi:uncharacterized membrane protein
MLLPLVIGAAALGFLAVKRRRWRHYHMHRHLAHAHGCGHHGHHGWHGHGGGWRSGPYYVMAALDTTPGQEKVIREEVSRLRERGRVARDEAFAARGDLADALRADTFDRARFDAAAGRVDGAYAALKAALGDSLARVHETLDARQREKLADFLGDKRAPGFGPFR